MPKPGPGAYNVPSYIGTGRSVTMSPRYEMKAKETNPGPGAYELKTTLGGKGISIRPRTKLVESWNKTPGPGAYKVEFKAHHGITMASRFKPSASFPGPGPAAYALAPIIGGAGSPKYSMRIKPPTLMNSSAHTPGPGNYDVITRRGRVDSAVTMKSRHKFKDDFGGPGPGTYSLSSTLGCGPKFSMRARLEIPDNDK